MPRGAGFWVVVATAEVLFGTVVFVATRHYYRQPPLDSSAAAAGPLQQLRPWPEAVAGGGNAPAATTPGATLPAAVGTDPEEISRLADEAFGARQYDRAVELYSRLLALDSRNADVYNNLAITLHYAGRSQEALQQLEAGLVLDPLHQRSWLTLGFVNAQLGNVERSRTALTKALQVGTDEQIRGSAQRLLDELP